MTQPTDLADIDLTPDCDVLVDDEAAVLQMACQLWVVGLRLSMLLLADSSVPPIPNTAWWTVDRKTGSAVTLAIAKNWNC